MKKTYSNCKNWQNVTRRNLGTKCAQEVYNLQMIIITEPCDYVEKEHNETFLALVANKGLLYKRRRNTAMLSTLYTCMRKNSTL